MAPEIDLKPLPPAEAIEYFNGKGYRFSWRWQEMWHEDHVKAFTVAKAMRLDILRDIRGELDRALNDGTTFPEFQKNLTPILQRKGWWGLQHVGGETVQLGSPRRLKTIFDVNIQTAYSVGHYREMADPEVMEALPLWRYVAVNDGKTRPQHRRWHNTVLPAKHEWFKTHYPPNGWGCRCKVVAQTERDIDKIRDAGEEIHTVPDTSTEIKRDPRTGETRAFPSGIDPGWDYNPGEASVLWDREKASRPMKILPDQKTWKDLGRPDLRKVPSVDRNVVPGLLPAGGTAEEASKILAEAFGLGADKAFVDFATGDGDLAVLHRDLLPHMVEKRQETRERYGLYLLETLKNPYEVWLTDFEDGLRKQYIGVFTGSHDLLVSVVLRRDGTVVWNMMQGNDKKMNGNRVGTLVHAK